MMRCAITLPNTLARFGESKLATTGTGAGPAAVVFRRKYDQFQTAGRQKQMAEETRSSNPSDGFTFFFLLLLLSMAADAATVARASDFSPRGTGQTFRAQTEARILHIYRCTVCVYLLHCHSPGFVHPLTPKRLSTMEKPI